MRAVAMLVSLIFGTAVFGVLVLVVASFGGAGVGAIEFGGIAVLLAPIGYLAGRAVHRRVRRSAV